MSTMSKKKRKHALKSLKREYKEWLAVADNKGRRLDEEATYRTLRDFIVLSDDAEEIWRKLRYYRNTGTAGVS